MDKGLSVQKTSDSNQLKEKTDDYLKEEKLVPKFVNFQQNYRLAQKHSIEMCVIDGNSPDFFTAIMCFLHDPAKYKEANRTIYEENKENRLCKDQNEADKFNESPPTSDKSKENPKWLHLSVVREPIERFVASFHRLCSNQKEDKQICGNCGANFSCFLDFEYGRAIQYANDPKSLQLNDIDKEFFPQNWNCDFQKHLDEYRISKMESKDENNMKLIGNLFYQFRDKDVNNDDLTYIFKQINVPIINGETRLVEEAILESKLRSDVQAMKKLTQLYFHDFQLFNFEMPSIEEKV